MLGDRSMAQDKETTEPVPASPRRASDGIERVREILLGDIVAELERRLTRLDYLITHRNQEVLQDVRTRTDVLETHVRKELQSQSTRATHDVSQLHDAIRGTRDASREVETRLEERLMRLEERVDSSIARLERETRELVLAQAKTFIESIERVRGELRAGLVRELGLDSENLDEDREHAGTWPAPH